MATNAKGARSRYYDAVINLLDSAIKPELSSAKSLYAYNFVRRELARLGTLNDYVALVPENLAALHPDAATTVPKSDAKWRVAIAHEGRLLDEIEAVTEARMQPRHKQGGESSTALPEAISAASMQAYLRQELDPAITVKALRILSGGRSKQTILMTLADASGREVERIVRRDLATSPTGATVKNEFALLRMLADAGIPVPRPLLCQPESDRLGGPFIRVEKIGGALDGHIFDPPARDKVLAAARALGRLHAMPAAQVAPTLHPPANVAPDRDRLRAIVTSLRDKWNQQARMPSVTIDFIFGWLLANVDKLSTTTTAVHGDYSFHNLVFDGNELTAILDWELSRIGHPAEDLGYIRPAVLKRVDCADFMAAYREGGGPAIKPIEIVFYTLLEKLRLITMLFRARDYVDSGMTDDIELVDSLVVSVPRLVHQASVESATSSTCIAPQRSETKSRRHHKSKKPRGARLVCLD